MRALIIQHEESTPPGNVIDFLKLKNISYDIHFFKDGNMISFLNYDFYFILGGGLNVDQTGLYPWLNEEKKVIQELILSKKKLVGLCLGAQLIAEALKARVFRANLSEVGFFPVRLFGEIEPVTFLHWHSYQFELPQNATPLGESTYCQNQGYTVSDHILAFQFHPEADKEWLELASKSLNLPAPSESVQSREELLLGEKHLAKSRLWFFNKLDNFFKN